MTERRHIDGEGEVEVIHTEPMTPPGSTDLVAQGQTARGIALFEERVAGAKRMLRAALKLVAPGQIMVYGEGDKQSVYFTAGAADRILRHGFGMRWGPKKVTVDKTEEAIVAVASADLLNPDGSVYENFLGTRRAEYDSGRAGGVRGYLKDEQAIIKGALANMRHRAVHEVMGVNFLTPADCKEMGLDLSKLERRVEYNTTDDSGAQSGAPRIEFGKNKGTPLTDLSDKQLDWYIGAARENIANPSKEKWRAKEEARLQGYLAEQARRAVPPPEAADDLPLWDEREPGSEG
jgi:hypothetical protein